MNIVFFGTGEFSATILKGLVDNNFNVVAVVSQPDKINARNNKIVFSSIKKYCLEQNITIHQFNKLNLEGEDVLKQYNGKEVEMELAICDWNSKGYKGCVVAATYEGVTTVNNLNFQ